MPHFCPLLPEVYKKYIKDYGWDPDNKCPHPGCPLPKRDIPYYVRCVLDGPINIYIPPFEHIHIACPAHPEGHVLYGSNYGL